MNPAELFASPRHLRGAVLPTVDAGVYALFLAESAAIPEFTSRPDGLIYIGRANGAEGFAGRCHFSGRTLNHSPRKSLAVLLANPLDLEFRSHAGRKWGLSPDSDQRLSDWMLSNLRIAFLATGLAEEFEKQLVRDFAPPLNLLLCVQGEQHRRISRLRGEALAIAHARPAVTATLMSRHRGAQTGAEMSFAKSRGVDARIDAAPQIAARYGLDDKRYRGELRTRSFPWHSPSTSWNMPRRSIAWRQMIEVAQELSGRDLGELS